MSSHSSLALSGLFALALLAPGASAQLDRWSSDFNLPGVVGTVRDATDFRGELAVVDVGAGKGAQLEHVGLWNGTRWRALPGTILNAAFYPYDAYVNACVTWQNDLVVGGLFSSIGTQSGSFSVARWDGTRWWSMAQGLYGEVWCLCVHNGQLFAGGQFTDIAGAGTIENLARWTGSAWVPVGGRLPGQSGVDGVFALHSGSDGNLYAGGSFVSAGTVATQGLARWDGTSWHAIGGGVNGIVRAITEHQGRIVLGGGFHAAPGVDNVAAWSGSAFVNVGPSASDTVVGTVWSLASTPTGLYVGGDLQSAGGAPASALVRFAGGTWDPLGGVGDDGSPGSSTGPVVFTLTTWGGRLVVGGSFHRVGLELPGSTGRVSWSLAAYDGARWDTIGDGMGCSGAVLDLVAWRGGYVAAGQVGNAGDQVVSAATWFDGRTHRRIGTFDAPITGVGVFLDLLLVSGTFTTVNGAPATRTMLFDGTTWVPFGNVLANDFLEYQGQLYAAAGGLSVWNGTGWSAVGGMPLAEAWDLCEFQGRLYVAGRRSYFQSDYLFEWDGTTMRVAPNGPNGVTRALLAHNGDLWVGGDFDRVGGSPMRSVARFDGAQFHAIGSGIAIPPSSVGVTAMAAIDGNVYLAGAFNPQGGAPGDGIVVWDGAMRSLGAGVRGGAACLLEDPVTGELLVGGGFQLAGGVPSYGLARYATRAAWTDLGTGLPGSRGQAQLVGTGVVQAGRPVGFRVMGMPETAFGLHVVGVARLDVPLFGGTLVPDPVETWLFQASPRGTAEIGLVVPIGFPSGTTWYVQSWFADGAAPTGFAATNAVYTVTP